MKVPIEWLKELVNFRAGPDQLAEMLTMAGLETIVLPGNVLEVDVLPNRSDCWSILGIAREVSALTKFKLKPLKFKVKEITKRADQVIKVEVRDRELCPRYMARVIENVKINDSPEWLKKRLELAGMRSINNVVDVTNYLLLELGQPMHAFDASLIADHTLDVRRANPGEKMKTLDGVEQELDPEVLLIADPEKAIAIAGVMGGANTEINASTKTVVLESAYFNPVSIHKTSKYLKVHTDSSVRFEHGVDWLMVEKALDRAAFLIAELGKGMVLKGKIDVKAKEPKPKLVELRPARVNQVLGSEMAPAEMLNILRRLGFKVSGKKIEIPLFRAADIEREIDLIEEISRIYGYDRIPSTMPHSAYSGKELAIKDQFIQQIRESMLGCGLNEVQNYSLQGPQDFENCGLSVESALKVANPLNLEEGIMRTKMLPGLLRVIMHNLNRQLENIFIFEIGKIYLPSSNKLPEEKWMLCVAALGSPFMSALDKGEADYFYLKGILENLLLSLGIDNFKYAESINHLLQPGKGADIPGMGIIGELHPDIRRNYGLEKTVVFFEIDLEELFKLTRTERRYQPLPKFPNVSRDISMFIPKGLDHQQIIDTIKKAGDDLVEEIFLFDKYKDSVAYRVIYRHPEKTLTDDEVNRKHEAIIKLIEDSLKVKIRR